MIGVTVQCRLGNQLFQYAFVKAQSKKLKTSFFLNEGIEKLKAGEYFNLKGYNKYHNISNKILFKFSKNPFKKLETIGFDSFEDPSVGLTKVTNNINYVGFFQSDKYFENISNDIKSYIKVKKKYITEFDKNYKQLFASNKVIAIHFRRTDYLNLGPWWEEHLGSGNLSLNSAYYEECLKMIPQYENYKIIFVGDDLSETSLNVKGLENAMFTANEPIIDFQIMMNADICIISNSSFAWWAAYLNPKPSKKVLCPNYWLGFKIKKEYPHSIIPEDWDRVNTY